MTAESPSSQFSVLPLVLLVGVVVLSGCALLPGSDAALPDSDAAAEAYQSLDGYEATAHIYQTSGPDETVRLVQDVDGNRSRTEFLSSPTRAGNLVVYNGSTLVRYNATTNEYAVISFAESGPYASGAERIRNAIESAHDGDDGGGAPVDSAPLPVVPGAGDGSDSDSGQFTVSFEGKETVAGREAYVLHYKPVEDRATGILNQTVWLDAEYFVTIRAEQTHRFDENTSTYTMELSNVTFEPGLDDEQFQFDPPAGATLNESESFTTTTYDTRKRLAAATDLSVPDPEPLQAYDLIRANHINGPDFTAIELQYQQGTSAVFVTKTTEQSYADLTEGEPVTVGSETGRYRATGTRALVVWECDGRVYAVTGNVQKATLLEIARTIECN